MLCVTLKEQVAQIFGKPIFLIKDIAILPLSSQLDAEKAIRQVQKSLENAKGEDLESESSDEGERGDERVEAEPQDELMSAPTVPGADESSTSISTPAATNVAQNVMERRGYGRFASEWLSRRTSTGLAGTKTDPQAEATSLSPDEKRDAIGTSATTVDLARHNAVAPMLPRVLRTTKLLFKSRSYYFSYDVDITNRLGSTAVNELARPSLENLQPQYFWNLHLAQPFVESGFGAAVLPVMQGFVGQQTFAVKADGPAGTTEPLTKVLKEPLKPAIATAERRYLLTLISRRSSNRSGLRYLRRGIDDNGNCANFVESEQILSSPTWNDNAKIRSFVQVRGSIPLYFSQSPYSFKPIPTLQQSPETNRRAFEQHFKDLQRTYGDVHVVELVDKHGGEKQIGSEYEKTVRAFNEDHDAKLQFEWFDFHAECRGMKFENVQKLITSSRDILNSFGETVAQDNDVEKRQQGVIRTNCMDCLDRTNVVQSAFAQEILQKELESDGVHIDFVHDPSSRWFNSLWADNGDAMSRQYTSTAALKGDFTRTRKRDYRGALNDLSLTMTRYYNNIINDFFSQTVIDLLLGNVTSRVFDDLEADMMSADPGISLQKIRQNAIETCSRIVVQGPNETFLNGWTMLAPAHPHTLRTLPFEEAILVLTDHAIYGCRFDAHTEKVKSFERVDLDDINKIRFGTYITSTLTEAQLDQEANVGIVFSYLPGKGSMRRVNTRTLSVSPDTAAQAQSEVKEGGVLSWLSTLNRGSTSMSFLALKMIADKGETQDRAVIQQAQTMCDEISQAIKGGADGQVDDNLLEKADIISVAEARSRTGYLEQIGHSIKKFVWT